MSASAARRRLTFWPAVRALECRYELPAGLLDALLLQESGYRPNAISPAGALGLGQLMPRTARELGVGDPFDPFANLDGAARYLARQLITFGKPHLALAAYNAGPSRVAKARGVPVLRETRLYVANVLNYWAELQASSELSATEMARSLGFLR